MNTDIVLIAGAGPVGVLNALGLARQGIPVVVMEQEASPVRSPRAMVYHWSVLDGLDDLGLLEEMKKRGFTKQEDVFRVYKTGEEFVTTLKVLEGHVTHPYNIHLGQHRLVEIALEQLKMYDHAKVLWETRVDSVTQDADSVRVAVTRRGLPEEITGKWLIGADGARSAVRNSLDLGYSGFTWPERFVAANIRYDFEARGWPQTTMLIDDVYGAVISKIDQDGLWRFTYCEDETLPVEEISQRMPHTFDAVLPDTNGLEVVDFSPYKMHQRTASSFRDRRVLLVGDAAHSTNPAGGLGLTSGLFDTFMLYPSLIAVIRGVGDDALLDRYASERRSMFVESISPAATEIKKLVFHSKNDMRLDDALNLYRKMENDEELMREFHLTPKTFESSTSTVISSTMNEFK